MAAQTNLATCTTASAAVLARRRHAGASDTDIGAAAGRVATLRRARGHTRASDASGARLAGRTAGVGRRDWRASTTVQAHIALGTRSRTIVWSLDRSTCRTYADSASLTSRAALSTSRGQAAAADRDASVFDASSARNTRHTVAVVRVATARVDRLATIKETDVVGRACSASPPAACWVAGHIDTSTGNTELACAAAVGTALRRPRARDADINGTTLVIDTSLASRASASATVVRIATRVDGSASTPDTDVVGRACITDAAAV